MSIAARVGHCNASGMMGKSGRQEIDFLAARRESWTRGSLTPRDGTSMISVLIHAAVGPGGHSAGKWG